MAATGFEDLVVSALTRLEGKVDDVAHEMSGIKSQWEVERVRRTRLEGPLSDWSVHDSTILRAVIDDAKSKAEGKAKQAVSQEASDKNIIRWRERVVIGSAAVALIQSTFNIHVSSFIHWLLTGGHS